MGRRVLPEESELLEAGLELSAALIADIKVWGGLGTHVAVRMAVERCASLAESVLLQRQYSWWTSRRMLSKRVLCTNVGLRTVRP